MTSSQPKTLDLYLQTRLPPPCKRAGDSTVSMAAGKLRDARTKYDEAGYSDLPDKYEYRHDFISTAYDKMKEKYTRKLRAKPDQRCQDAYQDMLKKSGVFLNFNSELQEAQTRVFLQEIVVKPVLVALEQILRLPLRKIKHGIDIQHETSEGLADLSLHELHGGKLIIIMEVKKPILNSFIQGIQNLCDEVPDGNLKYDIDDNQAANRPKIILAKAVVNLILSKSKFIIVTDYHEWCFLTLEEPVTPPLYTTSGKKKPATLIVSQMYAYSTDEISILGTVAAIILDSYSKVDFSLKVDE